MSDREDVCFAQNELPMKLGENPHCSLSSKDYIAEKMEEDGYPYDALVNLVMSLSEFSESELFPFIASENMVFFETGMRAFFTVGISEEKLADMMLMAEGHGLITIQRKDDDTLLSVGPGIAITHPWMIGVMKPIVTELDKSKRGNQ